jgi:hypothetical protein
MKSKKIHLLLTGGVAWISLLLMITTTYGASIVIGGNYIAIDRMIIVSTKPEDTPKANGTALLNTLEGIPWNNINPYLIKLGPGTYDIGTSSLRMKPFVDVEGSGVTVTTITGNPSSPANCDSSAAVVHGSEWAEIRSLTVTNVGASSALGYAVGILNNANGGSPKLKDVSVSVDGSGVAFAFGVVNCNASPEMLNVRVEAFGSPGINRGIYNAPGGIPVMKNVNVYAQGGLYADGIRNEDSGMVLKNSEVMATGAAESYGLSITSSSSLPPFIEVENSFLSGNTYGILGETNASGAVYFSRIYGGVSNSGNIYCFTTYSLGGNPLNTNCQ